MKTLEGKTSLTKCWPGGRRNATVIKVLDYFHSVPVWNTTQEVNGYEARPIVDKPKHDDTDSDSDTKTDKD